MTLNPFVKAGIGLSFALLWSCPTLAEMTAEKNFGLDVKITGQSEDDRDLGTRSGGDVNGLGLDLRPWVYGERGNWSAYAMGQAVTATDTIETDTLRQNDDGTTTDTAADGREQDKSYLAMREFWVGYSGLTAYPGEQLRFGRQRLRSDDGMWRDTNIEALNWTFDTTLLKADLGVAQRFSEYRTDLTELAPEDKDRTHLYGNVATQWTPGHWVGVRAHHTHDGGSLKNPGETVDALDKTRTGDLTWLGLEANSDAYNWRNDHTVNYWGSVTWLTGDRDTLSSQVVGDETVATGKQSGDVNAWATDLGIRLRLDPQWQVGAAYARGSGGGGDDGSSNYEQTGLESNRSNYTGTRSRVHRFGEAFRGELGNLQAATLFASWQLRDDYDASFIYHKFWRVDGNQNIGSSGINAVVNDNGVNRPLVDGEKDLGQEMDVVVTKYFKQGLLPASMSQAIDEPSALVRLRAGVFKPGDAYGKEADSYMHRAFVDVIWRF
ncbi:MULTISPECIES: alginate export family protein [Pseudomonas]|jgi:alginate production protein|uniref:Alginate regulatory protein AlgE n=2 Tax=Pseudomonas putida group TaxID=136845 RepID=V9V7M0_9PSED|nr:MULTISPECIES: alginate export family protein [Pseudomonas]EJT85527.1 outer membrane protein AlgE [Pseudomonas putida S11]MCO6688662.1 alginate export family protein [Pseudomonas shirazica]AHC84454.1 alginate regulatory protein AlgE [Pseudomonas monteilii SB3078]AHC89825.1 alginate regulatory protein AlgE [Pseudomonas monteilii SB3101]KAF4562198.1 alginate export family protein [Pseudomonas sp. CES]